MIPGSPPGTKMLVVFGKVSDRSRVGLGQRPSPNGGVQFASPLSPWYNARV